MVGASLDGVSEELLTPPTPEVPQSYSFIKKEANTYLLKNLILSFAFISIF